MSGLSGGDTKGVAWSGSAGLGTARFGRAWSGMG
jgi:hypothetical protein